MIKGGFWFLAECVVGGCRLSRHPRRLPGTEQTSHSRDGAWHLDMACR
jgi:hypothetical protein